MANQTIEITQEVTVTKKIVLLDVVEESDPQIKELIGKYQKQLVDVLGCIHGITKERIEISKDPKVKLNVED